MAHYAGLSLRDIYARKCDELHCKQNSAFYQSLPVKPDFFEAPLEIDLSTNFVGSKGMVAVLEVVRCCTALTRLDFRDQQLSNETVDIVCRVLQYHPSVTHIDLSRNPITIEAGRALIDLAKANGRLEEILVHDTGMRAVIANSISVQTGRNKAAKVAKAASNAAVNATTMNTAGSDQPPMLTAIDPAVVREALRGFPNSVAPFLFDDEGVSDSLAILCQQYEALFYDTQFAAGEQAIQRTQSRTYNVSSWKRVSSIPDARILPALPAEEAEERRNNAAPTMTADGARRTTAASTTTTARDLVMPPVETIDPAFSWAFTSLMACHGDVYDMIRPQTVSPYGLYTCKFFIDGKWRYVVVDDLLPVTAEGTIALVPPSAETYYWPCIVAKALAKLHGSYQAIDQSITSRHASERKIACATTMADITGGVGLSRDLHHEGFNADDWWATLLALHGAGAHLVATSGSDAENAVMTKYGVAPFHSYQILHARQINGYRLLHVQSQFTEKRWSGEWSAESPLWEQHSDIAGALDFHYGAARGDSAFWMPYVKFLQVFEAVHICRTFSDTSRILEGEWTRSSAGGPYFESSWHMNPRYKVSPSTSGNFFINLSLPDPRFSVNEVDTVGFQMLRGDTYPLRYDKDTVVAKTKYVVTTSVSYEGVVSGDGDYWVVPSSYVKGRLGRFLLRVVGNVPFSVSNEPMARYWTQRTETVDVQSTGEYQNGEDNPQFALKIPSDTTPARLFVQMVTPETELLSLALFLCVNPAQKEERLLGPIAEDNVLTKSKFVIGNTITLEASVPGGETSYVVLPYVSPEGSAAKLQFRIWCSHPKYSVTHLPLWRKKTVECAWNRSGGYQDTQRNPQIELITPIANQMFVIRITAVGATDPSLILFVLNNHGRVGDPQKGRIPDDRVLAKSTYIRHHTAIKEFYNSALPRDSYIIVPCLQPPGASAKCVVTVSSLSEDFELRVLPDPYADDPLPPPIPPPPAALEE